MSRTHQILIGIYGDASRAVLTSTLLSINECTALPFDLVLLQASSAASEDTGIYPGLQRLLIPDPGGTAAAFNCLVNHAQRTGHAADIYVLVESGVRAGHAWLEHLLAALDSDQRNGLAGPSTNRCWNEQGVAPACLATPEAIEQQVNTLSERFGASWQTLEPLHSLADFCYVVRREVVNAVGAADEAYANGPCWEMDYNIRAARAGFRGIWAQSAFVYRGQLSTQRLQTEAKLLEHNKRLYQDRFCGRRMHGASTSTPYHASCRGDACADFAPASMTRIHLPLLRTDEVAAAQTEVALVQMLSPSPITDTPLPLVSCIMPTRGRQHFVAQSITYFFRQDYPKRELIIVYEDDADLPPNIDHPWIRTVRTAARTSIGVKREAGARLAHGAILAHWDDDDWYADQRLSRQVMPITQGIADITGLNDMLFMAVAEQEFWAVTPALFRRLFIENVSGGTLIFRREVWEHSGPYPATSLREEADFMVKALRAGARLCRLPGRDLCIYVRHQGNTWKFREGHYLQESGWSLVPVPEFLARDYAYYFPDSLPALPCPSSLPLAARQVSSNLLSPALPLVSCIMPTANRRAFVPRAIQHFMAQDYTQRELIIIDDGSDSIADLVPQHNNIRYVRLERRASIGEKRNLACEMATGELIAHWDDDDWMAPSWLSSQVTTLLDHDADICGLNQVFFYAAETRQAWRYVYDGSALWVCGGTMCYRRTFWQRARFPNINIGEDNAFVWSPHSKRLAINHASEFYVAMVHAHNTSPKATGSRRWHNIPAAQVEEFMQLQAALPVA